VNTSSFFYPRLRHAALGAGALLLFVTLNSCGYSSNPGYYQIDVPNSIAVADVNGDGVPDLLVATTADQGIPFNPGFANVILGNTGSPGTFKGGTGYQIQGSNPSSIAVADIFGTGNGPLDLAVANYGSGNVSLFMHGASPGTFNQAVSLNSGGSPNQIVAVDLNGDGHVDFVLGDLSGSGFVIVLLQNGASPGTFLAPMNLLTAAGWGVPSAQAADLSGGKGPPDIVAAAFDANGNNGSVYVFLHNPASPGTFLAPVRFPAGAQPQSVKIADVNGDGLPDLIVANQGPGTDGTGTAGVSVLLQDPAHPYSFLAPVTYATPGFSIDVAVGTLSNNPKAPPDLVVANLSPSQTGSISVLLHDPAHPGQFLAATSYTGFGQPLGVAIADLNLDGYPDIAVADGQSAVVMLQSSATPGTFQQGVQVGN